MNKYQESLSILVGYMIGFRSGGKTIIQKCINTLQELINTTITPTFEEVKKEWEELGYEYQKNCNGWQLVNEEKEEVIVIEDDNKLYAKTDTNGKLILYFTLQEHQLLTKTFRALGWEVK